MSGLEGNPFADPFQVLGAILLNFQNLPWVFSLNILPKILFSNF